jgi:hypothetical protein
MAGRSTDMTLQDEFFSACRFGNTQKLREILEIGSGVNIEARDRVSIYDWVSQIVLCLLF